MLGGLKRWLPPIGSPRYHIMLALVAILILGPLGGVSAAFMNFSIGFFVGGQVLAGILGSVVTLPYGPEGKHGANYMQTMAASVAGMCGMAVLIQAMVWLGLPEPPAWELVLYFTCIGMYGVGLGMLYTPIVVDRMQLSFPSGFAVANILRALTDRNLLKRSIAKLGSGMGLGYAVGLGSLKVAFVAATGISVSTLGAGMIVGARIALAALQVALIGHWQMPRLVAMGWLDPGAPYRKIGFVIALGTILGAALLDIVLIMIQAARRIREKSAAPEQADWKRVNWIRLILWILFWGAGTAVVGSQILHQPLFFLAIALLLSLAFVLINGISVGISDSNPISSAFVVTVFILAALGLRDAGVGLMCASILLIACAEGADMQQDRSTGWRLGTNRVTQFRYQVIGIATGAVLAVVLAKVFMQAYPILRVDQFNHSHLPAAQHWQSAMTYKFVGALNGITTSQPHVMKALRFGFFLGLGLEVVRKLLKRWGAWSRFRKGSRTGAVIEFIVDSLVIPSPYASSFGGFVELPTILWWTAGGVGGSLYTDWQERRNKGRRLPGDSALPEDMSTTSLVGGGLIAGDSLAALTVGIVGLLSSVLG
jgi:uncharacterized oligopeptide transporter (OPT) family protein